MTDLSIIQTRRKRSKSRTGAAVKKGRRGPAVGAVERSSRRAIIVLGMHRSGTSAFTRVLNLLGLDLPTPMPASPEQNRQGFWESAELVELHDHALASCNSWWGDWRSIPRSGLAPITVGEPAIDLSTYLKRDFATSNMFVIKDPRICRIVPLWLQTFAQLNIEPLVVITVRHPAEVAASLAMRDDSTNRCRTCCGFVMSWMLSGIHAVLDAV